MHKIPKTWLSEPDTEPKIGSEHVSPYVLTLLNRFFALEEARLKAFVSGLFL